MKLHYLLFHFFVYMLFCGCVKQKKASALDENSSMPVILSLENIVDQTGEESLSSLQAEIEYIPLETTDQSILSGISKITRLVNKNIVLADRDRIMMYNSSGKFIRNISQKGNGPADYTRISALTANPHTGGFFLLTNNKVIEFDATGDYLGNFEVEDRLMEMVQDPVENNLILHRMNIPKSPEDTIPTWFLVRYDLQGKELNRYEDITPRMKGDGIISIVTPIRPFYAYKDKVRFNEFGNDTIFNIEKDGLHPFLILNLGNMRMSASPEGSNAEMDAVFAQMKEKLFLGFLTEDNQFLYMTFGWGFGGDYLYTTFNKETGQITNHGNGGFLSFSEGLENDIDGGLPFFPFIILPDGSRIQWKTAEDFRESMMEKNYEENTKRYGEKFEVVHKLAQSLEDDDNPVLIIVK